MRNLLLCSTVLVLVFVIGCSCHSCPSEVNTTAVLGAFADETALLRSELSNQKDYQFENITFSTGILNNRRIVLADTGMGKVNASMVTAFVIAHFEPDEIIFTGIAGSTNPTLDTGNIIIAEKVVHHDHGLITDAGFETKATTNPVNNLLNPIFFESDPRLLKLTIKASENISLNPFQTSEGTIQPKIITGTIATGDSFIASDKFSERLHENLGADAVEMEGAAVAQICYQQNIPFIVIRSISDKADSAAVVDVEKFKTVAAENSATLVSELLRQLNLYDQRN